MKYFACCFFCCYKKTPLILLAILFYFLMCIVAKMNVASFLLKSFFPRCGIYFAQWVSVPSWRTYSECFAFCDVHVTTGLLCLSFWKCFSFNTFLTLYCNFHLAVALLPGSIGTRTEVTRTEHSLWFSAYCALLVLTFSLMFGWSFIRVFLFFVRDPIKNESWILLFL